VYVAPLRRRVERWQRLHAQSDLFAVDAGDCLLIWDLRPDIISAAAAPVRVLDGLDRQLYLACDAATDLDQLVAIANGGPCGPNTRGQIEERLAPLLASHLMLHSGGRYLSLAISLGDYSPPPQIVDRFHALAARLGRSKNGRETVMQLDELRQLSMTSGATPQRRAEPRRPAARRATRPRTLSPDQFTVTRHGELIVREHLGG